MKLIHIADLHLDSPMESNLPSDKARQRKAEILATFADLVEHAAANGVTAILISGDLFDSRAASSRTVTYVLDLIRRHPALYFFYLSGNHDGGGFSREADALPENLITFGEVWQPYELELPGDAVTVFGCETPNLAALSAKEGRCNVVMMHGQLVAGNDASGERIPLSALKNKNLDYVALGHLHSYAEHRVDNRCVACYAGCLEGRGFDECGEKGYVLLETGGGRLTHRFVPFATRRTLHTVECDLTDKDTQLATEEALLAAVAPLPAKDMVKVVLTGKVLPDTYRDLVHLGALLSERFFFAKLEDKTRLRIDPERYRKDVSLRGEFVRRVLASELSEEEKERVIAVGFRALCGEEVGL